MRNIVRSKKYKALCQLVFITFYFRATKIDFFIIDSFFKSKYIVFGPKALTVPHKLGFGNSLSAN